LRVGQLTLRSSPMVSFIYRRIAFGCWRVFFLTSFFATRYSLNKLISIFGYGQNAARIDGVARIQAGQAGIEPTTPGFGDRCSAKLSYWPISTFSGVTRHSHTPYTAIRHVTPGILLRLAVQGMLATARAEFTQLQATRVIAPILFSCVIPFLTLGASQSDYRSDIFL
jgi:hypothetical protein